MYTAVMSVKTDKEVKENAQRLAKRMGFPLGTLINGFLRQFIRDEAINFSIEPTFQINKILEKKIKKIEKDIKENKNMSPAFKNSKEMINYLDKNEFNGI